MSHWFRCSLSESRITLIKGILQIQPYLIEQPYRSFSAQSA